MLSPLQERVAEIIAGLDEARDFALAGGGAMIVRGDIQRQTRDLDFFGLTANAVDHLVPVVDRALRAAAPILRGRPGPVPATPLLIRVTTSDGSDIDLESDIDLARRRAPVEPPVLHRRLVQHDDYVLRRNIEDG